jgi:peroxiredoxin
MDRATQLLKDSGFGEGIVKVGDKVPSFELELSDGSKFSLEDALSKGPGVIKFYRGGWCPYCNMELQSYQQLISKFEAQGLWLLAIAPEEIDRIGATIQKRELTFPIAANPSQSVARSLNLVFSLPNDLIDVYEKLGLDIMRTGEGVELPVPATLIVNRDSTVVANFFDLDYTKRKDPSAILEAARALV